MVAVSAKVKGLLIDEGLITNSPGGTPSPRTAIRSRRSSTGSYGSPRSWRSRARRRHPPVDLRRVELDVATIETVDPELCGDRGFIPITRNGDVLTIAVSDPFDVLLFDDLKRMTSVMCGPCSAIAHGDGGAQWPARPRQSEVDELMDEVSAAEGLDVKSDEQEAEDIEFEQR